MYDLVAILVCIHFFGALVYGIFGVIFRLHVTGNMASVAVLELHFFLGIISLSTVAATVASERLREKFMGRVVLKWFFWFWLALIGIMILWFLF